MELILHWFDNNSMVANAGKFKFIIFGQKYNKRLCLDINGKNILNSKTVELLRIIIDKKLNFHAHIDKINKKASNYTHSLKRVCHNLNEQNTNFLITTFSLIMFCLLPTHLDAMLKQLTIKLPK